MMRNRILIPALLTGIFCCFTFFQQDGLSASMQRGKTVYRSTCISCHMPEGQGLEGRFPPLVQTGRLSDKKRLINIIFNGLKGPITIKGTEYNEEMMPLTLSDQDAADVLNYIRNSWGNKAPAISINDVKKLKKLQQ
ncbi:c-type cytochrome [Filimonas effusa]|uniref:Cytochrome c n=1 Tax=Filimonas effusa TaxID=2508721 RepID=A0A4V1MAI8_9BACT|nr:cytochrome c [Filimonas effusa]RXK86026.1 cytochrome c [Filimonas effusa]